MPARWTTASGRTSARSPACAWASQRSAVCSATPSAERRAPGGRRTTPCTSCPRRFSASIRNGPTKPPAPVTSARTLASAPPQTVDVGADHHLHERGEPDLRPPAEHALRLARVPDQVVDLGRTEQLRIEADVIPPPEPDGIERDLYEILDRVRRPGGDHVVVGRRLLEHPPHRLDVVPREAPVAPGLEVPETQFPGEPDLDGGYAVRDLARHELEAAPRALVIEEDARAREQAVALAVIDGDVVTVDLGHAVRAARIERRRLRLRALADLAEHLARARLVEACLRGGEPERLEDPRHADGVELRREHRLLPRGRDERLRREVVDLVGTDVTHELDQRQVIEQVRLAEIDLIPEVGDALEVLGARSAHHADHAVPLREKQLREIRPVLAGDAGDEGGARRHELVRP